METWRQYYILNFIRQDWREHIYSKIWINRDTGRMAIHQLFDQSGKIVAEGRFGQYRAYSSNVGGVKVDFPMHAVFLWPRDKLVMEIRFDHVKINENIPPERFDPVIPKNYRIMKLHSSAEDESLTERP